MAANPGAYFGLAVNDARLHTHPPVPQSSGFFVRRSTRSLCAAQVADHGEVLGIDVLIIAYVG